MNFYIEENERLRKELEDAQGEINRLKDENQKLRQGEKLPITEPEKKAIECLEVDDKK